MNIYFAILNYIVFTAHTLMVSLSNVLIYLLLGVSVSSLWPATPIGSFVMEKLLVPPPLYRKPHIFADAAVVIGEETTDKYDLIK